MVERVPNYLRAHRKRCGFTQDEVAYLLGCRYGTKVSRYERFQREPTLRTALGFEIIFATSVRELFAGIYDDVEHDAAKRARWLLHQTRRRQRDPRVERKLATLGILVAPAAAEVTYEPVSEA